MSRRLAFSIDCQRTWFSAMPKSGMIASRPARRAESFAGFPGRDHPVANGALLVIPAFPVKAAPRLRRRRLEQAVTGGLEAAEREDVGQKAQRAAAIHADDVLEKDQLAANARISLHPGIPADSTPSRNFSSEATLDFVFTVLRACCDLELFSPRRRRHRFSPPPVWRNGRRDRLKICFTQVSGGSSPSTGTSLAHAAIGPGRGYFAFQSKPITSRNARAMIMCPLLSGWTRSHAMLMA